MYYLINLANYPFSLLLLSMVTQLKVNKSVFDAFSEQLYSGPLNVKPFKGVLSLGVLIYVL